MKDNLPEYNEELVKLLDEVEKILKEKNIVPTKWELIMSFCSNFLWYFFATYGLIYFIRDLVIKFYL